MIDDVIDAVTLSMKAHPKIIAALGNPPRIYDAPVKHALMPFAVWRRWEQKPLAGDYENAVEYTATLEVVCKYNGIDDAKAAVAALQKWAIDAKPESDVVNIILVMTTYGDVYRAINGKSFYGVVRFKIIATPK